MKFANAIKEIYRFVIISLVEAAFLLVLFVLSKSYSNIWFSVTMAASIAAIIIFNLLLYKLRKHLLKRLDIDIGFLAEKEEIENTLRIITQENEHISEVYRLNHDLKNHMSVLSKLHEEDKTDEMKRYVTKLIENLKEV